jgi:hypothetical protein
VKRRAESSQWQAKRSLWLQGDHALCVEDMPPIDGFDFEHYFFSTTSL